MTPHGRLVITWYGWIEEEQTLHFGRTTKGMPLHLDPGGEAALEFLEGNELSGVAVPQDQ
jgi:hypothetical protein